MAFWLWPEALVGVCSLKDNGGRNCLQRAGLCRADTWLDGRTDRGQCGELRVRRGLWTEWCWDPSGLWVLLREYQQLPGLAPGYGVALLPSGGQGVKCGSHHVYSTTICRHFTRVTCHVNVPSCSSFVSPSLFSCMYIEPDTSLGCYQSQISRNVYSLVFVSNYRYSSLNDWIPFLRLGW